MMDCKNKMCGGHILFLSDISGSYMYLWDYIEMLASVKTDVLYS
jgi:hypothetical protein